MIIPVSRPVIGYTIMGLAMILALIKHPLPLIESWPFAAQVLSNIKIN